MQLNQSGLTIQSIDSLEIGSKVVFIGDDPFSPDSWSDHVQTVVEIVGSNILAHQKDSDRHRELRNFSDFRFATSSERESGKVNHAIDGTNMDIDDDEDVQDTEEMHDDENLGDEVEPEEQPAVGVKRINDWAGNGMSNSLAVGILVVALDQFDEEIVKLYPEFDVNRVYHVLSISQNTDTIMITDRIKLPAHMFRYLVSAEFENNERIYGLEEKADEIVRDAIDFAKERGARAESIEALTAENYPKWVLIGIAEELVAGIQENEARLINHLDTEMALIRDGKAAAPIIGWAKFTEIEVLVRHVLTRVARELIDRPGEYLFGRVIQLILGKARNALTAQDQFASIEILRSAEMEAYGGADLYYAGLKTGSAFTSLFAEPIVSGIPTTAFNLSEKQLRSATVIIKKLIDGEPLSAVNVEEAEWDLIEGDSSAQVQRYRNNRYPEMCKDVVKDFKTGDVITNVYQQNAITFIRESDVSQNFCNINSNVLAQPDAPYIPKTIFAYVNNNNMLVLPKLDLERLRPNARLIMSNGKAYNFIEKDGDWYKLICNDTEAVSRVSGKELTSTRTLSHLDLLSFAVYGAGMQGVIDKPIEYPQYFVVHYGDGSV